MLGVYCNFNSCSLFYIRHSIVYLIFCCNQTTYNGALLSILSNIATLKTEQNDLHFVHGITNVLLNEIYGVFLFYRCLLLWAQLSKNSVGIHTCYVLVKYITTNNDELVRWRMCASIGINGSCDITQTYPHYQGNQRRVTAETGCFPRSVLASGPPFTCADKDLRPLKQLTVKHVFFSIINNIFCH